MRVFKSPLKNAAYLGYRLLVPIVDPIKFILGVTGYFWYARDYLRYKLMAPYEKLEGLNLFPVLDEKRVLTPFDAHYFYQELWAFKRITKYMPKKHVDLASKYHLCAFLTPFMKVDFIDLRPIPARLPNLRVIGADILSLPYRDNEISSISSLHVIEHIGLGRYGDAIDPDGTKKAIKEILRVTKSGGNIYVSLPIGKHRVCFNAHRVHSPQEIIHQFKECILKEFSVVDDKGVYRENVSWKKYTHLHYGCGMFLFKKM